MLRKKKILTTALCAGGVVLSAVMADDTTSEATTTADGPLVSQPFDTAVADVTKLNDATALSGTWAGYGSVTNQDAGYTKPSGVGSPINKSTDKLYLSVDGYVTCTAATTENKPATVDMMIQIAKPDEELALPTGETGDIQIAVGVETDGSLKVYCKNRAGATGWYTLDKTPHAEGEWHRVSFTFDYGNGTCQIRLDGEPLMTEDGYLTSDPKGASADIGSWYKLNTTAKNLKEVKVVGSTAIDEVVIKQAVSDTASVADVLPALADIQDKTAGVPNQWIAEQGVTRDVTQKAPDGSDMTVADKYKAGFTVADGKKLEITKMSVKTDGVELTVPIAQSPDGYKNVIEVKNGETLVETKDIASGVDKVTATIPSVEGGKAVKYTYQIKTQTK